MDEERRQSDFNREVIRKVEEAWSAGDIDALEGVFAPDFKSHSQLPGLPEGIEGFRILAREVARSFPDRTNTIEEIIADGDRVAVRIRSRGTNEGGYPPMGIEPNGLKYDIEWMSVYRLRDGQVVEHWGLTDIWNFANQLKAPMS